MPIRLSGLVSNLDTDAIVQELMSAQSLKKTKIENKITKLEWKQEKWKELNTKIYSFYTGSLSKMRLQGNYASKKASSTNETAATATVTSNASNGAHKLSISKLASSQYTTGGTVALTEDATATKINSKTTLADLGMEIGEKIKLTSGTKEVELEVSDSTTVNDFLNSCKSAGLNASFDETQKRFFISSKESGSAKAFTIESINDPTNGLTALGLNEGTKSETAASDAEFTLDGAAMTSSSNSVTVNGMTLELKEESASDITITISNDADAVYNMVKEFVTGYNELLEELNDSYYAGTARGYDPLTDEEKEAMTDDQIEKWETKIKDSLLRRDDRLGGLLTSMKTTLSSSVKVNGKSYSLASFGIGSADYTEKGKLHIDGNSEDTLTADNKDKLKKAINEDPNAVMEVMSSIFGNLYSTMQDKMKSTTLSSALTFYNDKEMKTTLTKHEKELKTMEDKLQDLEDKYYKQFTAMEKAMSTMNSQQSALSSMISG